MTPILTIEQLRVEVGSTAIIEDFSLDLQAGEAVGLAGESGSGKTTVALAVLRALSSNLRIAAGRIILSPPNSEPINVERRSEWGMERVRWRHIALVVQSAMNGLDPVQRVGDQIVEVLHVHDPASGREENLTRVAELLDLVGMPARRAGAYPHELSGGQRQRLMIALALACRPDVLIADEPTTGLDVGVQSQILALLRDLRDELGLALLLVTHDLAALAETCDRAVILYGGRIVEQGPTDALFRAPAHPYTKMLLAATPHLGGPRVLPVAIPGQPPDPASRPSGCVFRTRCPLVEPICERLPATREVAPRHTSACHRTDAVAAWTLQGRATHVAPVGST